MRFSRHCIQLLAYLMSNICLWELVFWWSTPFLQYLDLSSLFSYSNDIVSVLVCFPLPWFLKYWLRPCLTLPRAPRDWNHNISMLPILHNTYCLLFCVTIYESTLGLSITSHSSPASIPQFCYILNKSAAWPEHCKSHVSLSICLFWISFYYH